MGTEHNDLGFQARKSHIEESLTTWKSMNLNTRRVWFDHAWSNSIAAVRRGALADPQLASSAPANPVGAEDTVTKTEPTPSPTSSSQEDDLREFEGPAIEPDFHVAFEDVAANGGRLSIVTTMLWVVSSGLRTRP